MMRSKAIFLFTTACGAALISAAPVRAQQASQLSEIIVTARKRQESILNVPVVETAIPQQRLERFQTQDLKDIAAMVPGLMLGENVLSIGAQVSLRGVGTSSSDPGVDPSVSLNVDGMQINSGLAYRSSMFDLGQVEVLKGPQSLFYGKSSPGGVISIRTADPTDKFEVIARAAYEFEAQEQQGEIIISGPVTDSLKLRLASQYDTQKGFFNNIATGFAPLGGRTPSSNRISPERGYVIRGTALWNPISQFDARLKINQVRDRTLYAGSAQMALCPDGTGPVNGLQFLSPADTCRVDRDIAIVDLDPSAFPMGLPNNGTPYTETTQTFGTLEFNYRPRPDLTVTSNTGYYLMHSSSLLNTSMSGYAAPILAVTNSFRRREVTEDLRANSDFTGPLNFTLGAYLERGELSDLVTLGGNARLRLPTLVQKGVQTIGIDTDSVYGQVRWKVIPKVEIAAGARWTDEKRTDTAANLITGVSTPVTLATPKIKANNVSPELTITYLPTSDLTFFGALKKGYKSGSFSIATPPTPHEQNAFGDEKVEGGEVGMKSRWMDRRLAFNLAAYDYRYTGLQVGAIIPVQNSVPVIQTINAGSALVYGLETDVSYRPEFVEGLGLHGALNWNHARFKQLDHVPCFGGQTIAEGCNENFSSFGNAGLGGFTAQNQSGLPLVRAPNWEANFGFDYETDIGNEMKVIVSSSTQFSSKYLTNLGYAYYQKAFLKTDLNLTLQGPKDRWEFAVIGKNLSNSITSGFCSNSNFQGGLLPGEITGTNRRGPAGQDEIGCFADRGREVWLRLTLRPFS